MARKKKVKFEIELLERFKKNRRPSGDTDFWFYVGEWCRENQDLYFIPEIGWLYSWSDKTTKPAARVLFDLIRSNKECNAVAAKWTIDALTKPQKRGQRASICRDTLSALITLDGQIFLRDYNRLKFLTTIKYECEDGEVSTAYRNLVESNTGGYTTLDEFFESDELYNPAWWEIGNKIHEIEYELFNPALDKAYNKWFLQYKKTDEYKEQQLKRHARKLARETNKKMDLCFEAKETIEVLQAYLKDIESGKATRTQNVKVYEQLKGFIMTNKRAKTMLINDKKSLKK